MISKADVTMLNFSVKGFGISFLVFSLSFTALAWKCHFLESMWWLTLGIGLTGIVLLGLSRSIAMTEDQLNLSNAVWQYSAEAFPMLRIIGGCFKGLAFSCLALSFAMIILSIRIGYNVLESVDLHAFLETTESAFFTSSVEPKIAVVLGINIVLMILLTVLAALLTTLSRRWQRVIQLSTNDQTTMDALDKLTTLELCNKKIYKADAYSLSLLKLAEKMRHSD